MFGPLFVVLLLLVAGALGVTWLPLRKARDAWRAGRNAEAIAEGTRWSRMHVWPRQYAQLLAAALLTSGNRTDAKPYLDAMRGGTLWVSAVSKEEVAARLFKHGHYQDFLDYDDAVRELRETPEARLARAAAQAAVGKIDTAEATLQAASGADAKKIEAVRAAITQRKQGNYPYVLDRNGKTIAAYQIANGDLVAVNTDFEPFIDKSAGALTIESQAPRLGVYDTIDTTLDAGVQKAALTAISGFRASLVAIDPKTNEILAIASNRGDGPLKNIALEQQYEPGSVIKVLTGLTALSNGVDVNALFPYTCGGYLPIDGRQFGDWLPGGHGVLPTFDEALAESCNVVFADVGLRAGLDKLQEAHQRAGFDGQADLGVYQVPLGKTVGRVFNKFETGFYSIGLEHESINTLHLAMLASMMANRGQLTTPRLLRERRSILGEVVAKAPKQVTTQVGSKEAAERMAAAMRAVVTSAEGTGRRAAVEGVTLALKTGTAGNEATRYHALILAFAPLENPKLAFGIIVESAGSSEYVAAKMAHDFVSAMRPRL